ASARNEDSVSLSPAATAALDRQMIALRLISGRSLEPSSATYAASASTNQAGSSAAAVVPTDVARLAQQDPTQVIKDAVGAAQAAVSAISTIQGFYAAAASDPSVVQE